MTRTAIRRWSLIAATTAILMATGTRPDLAAAESPDDYRVISDKFIISLGTYLTDITTDAAVGSGGVIGTFIRVEDDLGITEDDTLFRVDGLYRFNRRHAISFGYWSVNRDGTAVITDQIDFDGNIFDLGVGLETTYDTTWLRIDWQYSFLRTDRGEAGISAGLSFYQYDITLEGFATVDDGMGGTIQEFTRAEEDIVAPVPTMGFFINFAITPNLLFRLKADFFDLDVNDIEGSLIDTGMFFEWYFSHHVGIGGGLTGSDLQFSSLGGDNPFTVDYRQTGLVGYFTFAFGEVD